MVCISIPSVLAVCLLATLLSVTTWYAFITISAQEEREGRGETRRDKQGRRRGEEERRQEGACKGGWSESLTDPTLCGEHSLGSWGAFFFSGYIRARGSSDVL